MKSIQRLLLVTAVLTMSVLTGSIAGPIVPSLAANSLVKADEGRNDTLVGTWVLLATLAPGFINTELAAFNPGGTWTTTSAVFNAHSSQNPFLPPFLTIDTSDGYGAWRRQGGSNRFAFAFKRLLFAGADTPTALYGPFFVGQHVGEATIQAVATLHEDGDTLEGQFTFQARNLRGDVVGTGSGPFSATRLRIEPLATP
jgi:hypothetical protein